MIILNFSINTSYLFSYLYSYILAKNVDRWGGVLSFSVKLSCDTHQGKGERVGNSPRGRGMGRGRVVEITISLEYALKYAWVLK